MTRTGITSILLSLMCTVSTTGCYADSPDVNEGEENIGVTSQKLIVSNIKVSGYGWCVEAAGNFNGAVVRTAGCNGSAGQNWTLDPSNFEIRVFGSKCLDIPHNNLSSALQIWDCVGTPQQKWNLVDTGSYPRHHIMAIGSGRHVYQANYPPNVSQALRVLPPGSSGWPYYDIYY